MPRLRPWLIGFLMVALLVGAPFAYYRYRYVEAKRFRIVTPGILYRSGQMTAAGFTDAIERYGIRTVVNVQNETPDPCLCSDQLESTFLRERGVRYVFIGPDLVDPKRVPQERPAAIDEFLRIMDDPANHPVLLHCRAGLHRTGVLTAVYRLEYEGWTAARAMRELRDNGFGRQNSSLRNDYIMQYVVTYKPRHQATVTPAAPHVEMANH